MREFHTKHKHHIQLWIVCTLIALVSGYIGFFWQPSLPPAAEPQATADAAAPVISSDSTVTADAEQSSSPSPIPAPASNPAAAPSSTQTQADEVVATVTLLVGEKNYTTALPEDSASVHDVMKLLAARGDLHFSGTEYGGGLGFFVQEINGVKNNPQTQMYWILSVNGQKAKAGASNTFIHADDTITWTYEKESY